MENQKYEVTDIAHETYPFLHRIRALRDIGSIVKAGDLGGFVEHGENLSSEPDDIAWIFDDAIAAGMSRVDQNATLHDRAVACDTAYVSKGSAMFDDARAEDNTYLRGAIAKDHARVSGYAMVLDSENPHTQPVLSGHSVIYGKIQGLIHVTGKAVVFDTGELTNSSSDVFVIDENGQRMVRDPARDELHPIYPEKQKVGRKRARDYSR